MLDVRLSPEQIFKYVKLYKEGKWKAPVPPVSTGYWDDLSWVKWILECGKFEEVIDEKD